MPSIADTPPGGKPALGWWRAVLNVAAFFAALAGANLCVAPFLPLPAVGDVSEKLAWFARHKDEYDAVFIGSSRVGRQIAPEVFDRRLAELTGQPFHSFNLGADSMFLPESFFVLDRMLSLRPGRLRWVVMELDDPKLRVVEHAGLVRREVYWHGLTETALMCEAAWCSHELNHRGRWLVIVHQLSLCAHRFAQVGRGQEIVSDLVTADRSPETTVSLGTLRDGFIAYRGTLSATADARIYERVTEALAAAQAGKPDRAWIRQSIGPLLRRRLRTASEAMRRQGIQPVFLVPPVATGEEGFRSLDQRDGWPPVLAFNEPAVMPELYRPEVRADTMHLNEPGARLFSRLLAERFFAECIAGQTTR